MTADELREQLDRRSETGSAGEIFVVSEELQRLRALECPEPERYVARVALSDVGRGYDIESSWPGHERFIEVKSTSSGASAFFMTENELRVLGALGPSAWLYRVAIAADGVATVVERLQDPIRHIPKEAMSTAVWRVRR